MVYTRNCVYSRIQKTNYGHEGIDSSIREAEGSEGLHEVSLGETRRHSISDDHECHEWEKRTHCYNHEAVRCTLSENLSDS